MNRRLGAARVRRVIEIPQNGGSALVDPETYRMDQALAELHERKMLVAHYMHQREGVR